jgi:hypothetical protein
MSLFATAKYIKQCQFREDQWRWLQRKSVDERLTMMQMVSKAVDFAMERMEAPKWVPTIGDSTAPTDEEILLEHRQNLDVVIGNKDEINFRYDGIFRPYVNGLSIPDERKASLIEAGKQITAEYLAKPING